MVILSDLVGYKAKSVAGGGYPGLPWATLGYPGLAVGYPVLAVIALLALLAVIAVLAVG